MTFDHEVLGLGLALIVQTAGLAFWLGVLSSRVTSNKEDVSNLGAKCREISDMEQDLKEFCEDHYVSKGRCVGINDKWEIFVKGVMERRELIEVQNTKDHKTLMRMLIEVKDCLHKLQNKKDC